MQTGLKVFQDPLNNLQNLIKTYIELHKEFGIIVSMVKLPKLQKPEAFLQRNWLFEYLKKRKFENFIKFKHTYRIPRAFSVECFIPYPV